MTSWWWVRHGPTHSRAFNGWTDVPADLGDQARLARLREFLPDDALVLASDLRRASATADAIAGARRRLPDTAALREFNFGQWEGLEFAEVETGWPALSRAYWSSPGDVTPPDGESWNDVRNRVDALVAGVTREFPGRPIIAVAHFGVILTQFARARGIAPASAVGQPIDNLSVTRIDYQPRLAAALVNHHP